MKTSKRALTVAQAASLCSVGHSTVGYWIRSKKIRANRVGRNYSIPVEELLFFLNSTGQDIPHELVDGNYPVPFFRTIQNCWQYWDGRNQGHNCKDCPVFNHHLEVCFTAKENSFSSCPSACHECQYYLETYFPRTQFIYQIDYPAAIYKDLHFWAGNMSWAKLCELQEKDLLGMGVEHLIHPDSLATVISDIRKRALGSHAIPKTDSIFLKNKRYGKLKVRIAVYPLNEPSGTHLILAEPVDD